MQRKLQQRAEVTENWLKEWWDDVAYLGCRSSVVVHSSPAMVGPKLDIPDLDTFVGLTAQLVVSHVMVKLCIDNEQLPPSRKGGVAFCADQFRHLFSAHRIPGEKVDAHRVTPPSDSLHVIIAHNGHFFKLQVLYPSPKHTLSLIHI